MSDPTTKQATRDRELDENLVEHVGKFLLELGQGFAFLGRQVRLELGGDEFYCDLLFYLIRSPAKGVRDVYDARRVLPLTA